MSGNKYFLDTNIFLYLIGKDLELAKFPEDKDIYTSFITRLELLSYPSISLSEENVIKTILDDCQIIQANQEIQDLTIVLKRKYGLKLPDAIIAASAYYFNIPLITADKGFRLINEVSLILYEIE